MGYLKINQEMLTEEKARTLVGLCPFGAMSWEKDKLEISAACKMCKLCVRNSGGAVEYVEKIASFDKFQWKGICVYADCLGGKLHRVTLELCGKARELAKVTGHEVYALVIGHKTEETAQKLLRYGVDKVFVYDHEALKDFRIEPYTALFCDFIGQYRPSSVLVGATTLGRQLAPRVAARCRTGLTADCTVLQMKENTDLVQIRPAFGGNIMAQIVTPNTRPQFCTARYKVFTEPAETEPTGQIVKLPDDATVGILSGSIRYGELLRQTCSTYADRLQLLPPRQLGAAEGFDAMLAQADAVLLPDQYEKFCTRQELDALAAFSARKPLLRCAFEIDEGSFMYVEDKIRRLSEKKNV